MGSCFFDETLPGDTLALNKDVFHWSKLYSYSKLKFSNLFQQARCVDAKIQDAKKMCRSHDLFYQK